MRLLSAMYCARLLTSTMQSSLFIIIYASFLAFIIIILRFFNIWRMVWLVLLHILTFICLCGCSFVRFSFLVVRLFARSFIIYLLLACLLALLVVIYI